MSNDKSRAAFEAWHRVNGNNTQGIKWVDDLVLAAWQASREVALNEAAEAPFTLDAESYGILNIRAAMVISDCVKAIRSLK